MYEKLPMLGVCLYSVKFSFPLRRNRKHMDAWFPIPVQAIIHPSANSRPLPDRKKNCVSILEISHDKSETSKVRRPISTNLTEFIFSS